MNFLYLLMLEAIVIKNVELYIPITEFTWINLNELFWFCLQFAKRKEQFKPLWWMPHLSLEFAKEVLWVIDYENKYLLWYIETLEKWES